jgi:hypothetical protein
MFRALLDEIGLFLLPFAAFALYLALRRRNPLVVAHWGGRVPLLALAGLVVAILALLITGLTGERHRDGFVPTHIENGRVVPGTFR